MRDKKLNFIIELTLFFDLTISQGVEYPLNNLYQGYFFEGDKTECPIGLLIKILTKIISRDCNRNRLRQGFGFQLRDCLYASLLHS